MGISASDLCQHVIRPTLLYMERHSASAEALLLGAAASQSALGSELSQHNGHGIYCISEQRHQQLWDHYLARDPDLASLVRGLASQRAFLTAPHLELIVNLRYATAIAWLLIEAEQVVLPPANDLPGLARIWRQVFQPQSQLRDFLRAWQQFVAPQLRAA